MVSINWNRLTTILWVGVQGNFYQFKITRAKHNNNNINNNNNNKLKYKSTRYTYQAHDFLLTKWKTFEELYPFDNKQSQNKQIKAKQSQTPHFHGKTSHILSTFPTFSRQPNRAEHQVHK